MSYSTKWLHKHDPKGSGLIYDPIENARFQKLHRGEITEEDFFMPENGEVGQRESPGYKKNIRMAHNAEAYRPIDPRRISNRWLVPPDLKVAFEEVLGYAQYDELGNERLILTMHPHIPRVCLFEVHLDPKKGERGTIWRPICYFCEDFDEKNPPTDLMSDPFLRHLCSGKSAMGGFRLPTRPEFEAIRKTDRVLNGVDAVEHFFYMCEEVEPRRESEREWEARTRDLLDYIWGDEQDKANQRAGSGWKMRSYPKSTYKHKETYYERQTKNGYVVVRKKAPYVSNFSAERMGIAPLKRGRTPEELELARLEVEAEKQNQVVTEEQRQQFRKLAAQKVEQT